MSVSKEKRLDMLLKMLEKETPAGGISADTIMKRLGLNSRQSVVNYIGDLRGRGIAVGSRKEGHTTRYYLAEKKHLPEKKQKRPDKVSEEFAGEELPQPIDRKALLRYHITRILESERDREMNIWEIEREYDFRTSGRLDTTGKMDVYRRNKNKNELEEVIEEMVARGEVIRAWSAVYLLEKEPKKKKAVMKNPAEKNPAEKNPAKKNPAEKKPAKGGREEIYHLAPRSVPVVLELNEDQCLGLYTMTENLKGSTPFEKHFDSIHQKVATAMGWEDSPVFQEESVIAVGREYVHFDSVQERLRRFDKIPFQANRVLLTIRGKSGEHQEEYDVGAIVYSVEKDKLYVVAHRKGKRIKKSALPEKKQASSRRDVYDIIDMEQIIGVSRTEKTNDWYNSKDCRDFLDVSFSVSTERPVRVEVRFNNTERNRKLLRGLKAHRRRYAHMEEQDGFLRYTDTVSGLGDFASFLRQFGSEAQVIAPQKLKERMEKGAWRVLERYGEAEHA